MSTPLTTDLIARIGLAPGASVLEIGAGTGQLTRPLLAAGLSVVALEPGERLRAVLADEVGADPRLDLHGGFFEEYDGGAGPFAAVWSANAFHWVDPAVSYRRAAELTVAGGHLVLIWNYPILPAELQGALNERVFAAHAPDSVRDPDTFVADLEAGAAAGRAELTASGSYTSVWSDWHTERLGLDVERFVALVLSYGHLAELTAEERAELAAKIRAVVGAEHDRTGELTLWNHIYTCIARAG